MFSNNPLVNNVDEASALESEAVAVEDSQQSLVETATLEQEYSSVLDSYIQQKSDQVNRIEDKLNQLLMKQQTQLQRMQSNKPSFLSLPKTKKLWRHQVNKQINVVANIQTRLTVVKEVKEGMGLHSSRIEELAHRKMRLDHKELCVKHDGLKEHLRAVKREEKRVAKANEQKTLRKGLVQSKTSPI